jgi:hypothetical protein
MASNLGGEILMKKESEGRLFAVGNGGAANFRTAQLQ